MPLPTCAPRARLDCARRTGGRRAGGGTRTHDTGLTKPLLYQLSYSGLLSGMVGEIATLFRTDLAQPMPPASSSQWSIRRLSATAPRSRSWPLSISLATSSLCRSARTLVTTSLSTMVVASAGCSARRVGSARERSASTRAVSTRFTRTRKFIPAIIEMRWIHSRFTALRTALSTSSRSQICPRAAQLRFASTLQTPRYVESDPLRVTRSQRL